MDPTREAILRAYESLAPSYDARIDEKPHNAHYDRPNTLSLLPEVAGLDVLDAACGPGKYAEILLARGARVTGFDLSPTMIELARRRNGERGTFFVHDLTAPLDRPDASFDVVLCALALHYLPDWTPALREFHRLLRPGGCLVLSAEHPFFEYGYFKSEHYFRTERVTAVWRGFGEPVEISSYRRPLQACLQPLLRSGFYLDDFVEPLPTAEMELSDPKHYRELLNFPAFLCLRAVKR